MNKRRVLFCLTALLTITSMVLTACGPDGLGPGVAGGSKTAICHQNSDGTYSEENVKNDAGDYEGHSSHPGDIIPAPDGGCPSAPPVEEPSATPVPPPPEDKKITICHATGSASNPYVEITVSVHAADGTYIEKNGTDHTHHVDDIIPAPADGCPKAPTETPKPKNNEKITICHATGSASNPYVEITVSVNAADGTYIEMSGTDHTHHPGDIIPAPAGGCPKGPTETPKQKEKITICHATGSASNPYVEITVSINAADGAYIEMSGTDHTHHPGDIIPAPPGGCPKEPTKTPKFPEKITLCHATGSDTNPYVEITVSVNAVTGKNGHEGHADDIIPAPAEGCPVPPTKTPTPTKTPGGPTFTPTHTATPEEKKITLCHATGSDTNPYVEITVSINAATGKNGHEGHANDIIPAPADGCPKPPTKTPTPTPTFVTNTPTQTPGGPTITPTETPTVTATPEITIVPPPPPNPATCPDFIIFHTFREGNLEVYRLDGVEGQPDSQLYNLTQSDAVDCRPSRSPNDAWVVYQTNRNGNVELYTTDVTGAGQTRLTDTSSNNINPMFGPDNNTVIYQSDRNGNWDLFTIDSDTHQEKQLTSDTHDDVNPFWSPDKRWVVFQSNRNGNWDIFLLDTQTGNEYSLVSSGANEIYPTWSPNGKQIAYLSNAGGVWNLHIINVDGSNDIQVTHGDGDTGNATWSPEGYRIAYQSERSGNLDVYSYDVNSKTEYRLTDFAGPDSSPTWNCGGSMISFTTTRSGNPDVYQVPWQGGTQSALTTSLSTDKWSEWSPSKETGSRGQ